MKKTILFLLGNILFAFNITPYVFTLKENYKEYFNNKVIDKDYTNLFDMNGIGLCFNQNFINAKIEYAYGNGTYKGATQDRKKIKVKENNIYLINALISFGSNLSFDLGYRFWDRGISNYEGDYEEQYYWPYAGVSLSYNFYLTNTLFKPLISYQKAINPQLKILAGNRPVLDLGSTKGIKVELPVYYRIKNITFFAFYRFQYWHINHSKMYPLIWNNTLYPIFEPESKTRNQYIGIGLSYNF